jgi:hypothetical protein
MAGTVFCLIKILRKIHGPYCVLSYQNTEENSWLVLCFVIKMLSKIHGPYCVLSHQNTKENSWLVLCSVLSKC